jgi:hypothetical protein
LFELGHGGDVHRIGVEFRLLGSDHGLTFPVARGLWFGGIVDC